MPQPPARLKVISRIKAIVLKHHFNIGNIVYADWSRAVDAQIPTLLTTDDNTFEEAIRNLLSQLKSSHTNFYRSGTNATMPQHVIGATLRSVSSGGPARWMFLDVFDDSPAARAGIRPGHFLLMVDRTPGERSKEKSKRPPTAAGRAKEHQLPQPATHRSTEDSILFGGVWNSLLETPRCCGSVTQSTRL